MDALEGMWRLVASRAWDEHGQSLNPPYGSHPMGQLMFAHGRMLAVLCNADAAPAAGGSRVYSSYGGPYSFDGTVLRTTVDVASDPARIGSVQARTIVQLEAHRIAVRPPPRSGADSAEWRELLWERVWRP
jgi:hypothetical protein